MDHQQAVQNLAVESYLLGDMSRPEREAFEEHFFECNVCGEDVRAAAEFMEEARKILGESGRPLPGSSRTEEVPGGRRSPGWLAWLKPQFAAPALAGLLLIIGFQSLRTIPDLQLKVAAASNLQFVPPIMLHRAVRGEPPVIQVPPGASLMLTLEFPNLPAKGTPLQFILKSAGENGTDGGSGEKELKRIAGEAPEADRPVILTIPLLDLPAGPYIVVAEIAAQSQPSGQELGRYPFRLVLQEGAERSK